MKKAVMALTMVLTVSIMLGVQAVKLAEANFTPSGPDITIMSPANYETYDVGSTILLKVTIRASFGADSVEVEYCLDGKENITLPTISADVACLSSAASWSELSEGVHSITVYARGVSKTENLNTRNSATCVFRIGESEPFPASTPGDSPISDLSLSFYAYLEEPYFVAATMMIVAVGVVFVVFLAYMRKHKH